MADNTVLIEPCGDVPGAFNLAAAVDVQQHLLFVEGWHRVVRLHLLRGLTPWGHWLDDVLFNASVNPAHESDLILSRLDMQIEDFRDFADLNRARVSRIKGLDYVKYVAFSDQVLKHLAQNLEEAVMSDFSFVEQVVALEERAKVLEIAIVDICTDLTDDLF